MFGCFTDMPQFCEGMPRTEPFMHVCHSLIYNLLRLTAKLYRILTIRFSLLGSKISLNNSKIGFGVT
jgi:hypothetical protein